MSPNKQKYVSQIQNMNAQSSIIEESESNQDFDINI